MIDVTLLRTGVRIKVVGEASPLTVQGVFMSTDGIAVSAKPDTSKIYERNVPLVMIEEILPEVK